MLCLAFFFNACFIALLYWKAGLERHTNYNSHLYTLSLPREKIEYCLLRLGKNFYGKLFLMRIRFTNLCGYALFPFFNKIKWQLNSSQALLQVPIVDLHNLGFMTHKTQAIIFALMEIENLLLQCFVLSLPWVG